MRIFDYIKIYEDVLTPEITSMVSAIHEYKGQQKLFIEAQPDVLDSLLEIAKIQSVESSNRIEGIITTDDRLKKIVKNKTMPKNRTEKEIAGYRDVPSMIHESYDYMPININMILQFNNILFTYTKSSVAGMFKNTNNIIAEILPDGRKYTRFEPVSAWQAPIATEEICNSYNEAINNEYIDPLIVAPMFILDFLCIHPFNDGNGRMSRLLTLLLLYRSDYIVGKYISIEKLIADNKELYYDVLQECSTNWHEGYNNYLPFIRYMLGLVIAAYKDFTNRVELIISKDYKKPDRVEQIIKRNTGQITKSDIMIKCPDISQTTVQRSLNKLLKSNKIKKIGGGRYTKYIWNWEN